jgi:transmembrane sensor
MKARPGQPPRSTADPAADAGSRRTPFDWPRDTGHLPRVLAAIELRKRGRQRRRRQAALGSVAALLVAGFVWTATRERSHPPGEVAVPRRTIVSSPERRTLPDGSIVELRDGSRIAFDAHGALRRVVLHHGAAHFQVVPDPDRPFVVAAGGMEFRALGTVFAVQLHPARVEMIVTEGRVAVEPARAPDGPPGPAARDVPTPAPLAIVAAGQQVTLELPGTPGIKPPAVNPLSSAESAQRLAWRVPRLELTDTPLAEVIAGINRHSTVRLELGHPDLAGVEISGILRADNVEPLLRTLADSYGIRAERREPGIITLHKAR